VPPDTSGYEPYAWLNIDVNDPDWVFTEGLLFTFVHGLTPAEVADRLSLPVQHLDLTNQQDPLRYFVIDGKAVFDAGDGWTVLYEDNGIPEDSSHLLAHDPPADQVVSVFTNVNSARDSLLQAPTEPSVRCWDEIREWLRCSLVDLLLTSEGA
jgi:hypothetical protein